MAGKGLFLIAGILLSVLKWKKIIKINILWIVLCFVVWFVLMSISIHNKNKDARTPRPVYIAGGGY